jgi:lysyl-tRNA synthetase class 2
MGKQFRNEGIDADHNPEFTTCEFYQSHANLETLFEMTEDMLQGNVFTRTTFLVLDVIVPQQILAKNVCYWCVMLLGMAKSITGSTKIATALSESDPVELSFEKPFRRINIVEYLEEKLGAALPDLSSK